MKSNLLAAALAALLFTVAAFDAVRAATHTRNEKPTIVLVHGAFADGSSWSKVIALLQAKGYHVVAVQNPTTSLADDVAATERAINQQTQPVVLVGHSWAGVVITQAGNNARVKALVYVDASAPDSGQSISDAAAGFPPPPWVDVVMRDESGMLTLPAATVAEHFGQDLSPVEQGVIAATQVPWSPVCLTDKVTHAAWHEKPSWWVIGEKDHFIAPALQRKMAAKIQARVTKLPTSHLAMLADPAAVTAVILAAADKVHAEETGSETARSNPVVSDRSGRRPTVVASTASQAMPRSGATPTAREVRGPAPVVPLSSEPPVQLIIDPPLADPLAHGRVVIQYRAENLRIVPVFGPAALDVSPRVGHIHVTVDDAPWHWLDASGEPLTITGLPVGPHKVLIELVNASHQTLDFGIVHFEVPQRSLTAPDPRAGGFRSAPGPSNSRLNEK